jgi:hypothetical protein
VGVSQTLRAAQSVWATTRRPIPEYGWGGAGELLDPLGTRRGRLEVEQRRVRRGVQAGVRRVHRVVGQR